MAAPFEWYRYEILGNLGHLDALLHGDHRDLARLAAGLPVADIGAADGDLAFSLERVFGWDVDIVDNAPTNQNGLEGARALRVALGSNVGIHDIDLDTQFQLPRERYGLVFFLGILYHLQNPYHALRQLAQRSDHCLLSTRVAHYAGSPATDISGLPIAYLVSPTETNNDSTNYWIFSRTGLDRIVSRAGWEVLERTYVGDVAASDPSSPDHDERAFMLLRSLRR
ncbi:MAG: methyltransferase domain-containing protein [Solirubrobacteraceae bacterium]